MKQFDLDERVARSVALFKEGYNCAQSVAAAYGDLYGLTFEQSLRVSASFGGGIGRMRETCGAACGMFIIVGLETAATDGKDHEGKAANYKAVQELATEFAARNGALKCGTLLDLQSDTPVSSIPQERNAAYYAKRPCVKIVEEAARIVGEFVLKK